ncbi:hypothetical protein RhiirA4_544915 [Rhizophagus irregularis]|uniref:Uncharacterized protein n=1 Tax=Rhizophagus irregularis TaxID=588596 RepID=A0A2I1GQH6_9GLOM|nr:hypothetical protein RhiirA4_544915 [Rhizophagus irregularis]
MEQTYSDTSADDKIKVYEFLEALRLLDNEVSPVNMDDDDNNESDIDEEDNISDREKNRLFDAFSRSNTFGVKEHNALLDVLADPMKGWDLNNY